VKIGTRQFLFLRLMDLAFSGLLAFPLGPLAINIGEMDRRTLELKMGLYLGQSKSNSVRQLIYKIETRIIRQTLLLKFIP